MDSYRKGMISSLSIVVMCLCIIADASGMTLAQAEQHAIKHSSELKADSAKASALRESAIADGQFADPKLVLGAMNVPVDSFSLSQEPMTQMQIGIIQVFPRGRSLHYRELQKKDLSIAEIHKRYLQKLQLLQQVRTSWLSLYYWLHAQRIVTKQKQIFRHLVKVTESQLGQNRAQQKDVLRAQLALSAVSDRLLNIKQQIKIARAKLARWVGVKWARLAHPSRLPRWHLPPPLAKFVKIIKKHPVLTVDAAYILAGHAGVHLAKQQYFPGFSVGASYGVRQGHNPMGQHRSDFLSAQISVDIPLFTNNRQDRRLKASEDRLVEREENQMSSYRQLREILTSQYAVWQQVSRSARLYKSRLLPEAKQYAEATMTAYQNAQTDFPTLADAYVRELATALAALKARVAREQARVNLLYIQGK